MILKYPVCSATKSVDRILLPLDDDSFYEYFQEPWRRFSLKMKQLSDAMSCIAIDVVNTILVCTEHRDPLRTREDSLGRRVTQRNRKEPRGSSN